jgi:hypothetical protein
LPERYLRRRAERLDQLESSLGDEAMRFRASADGSPQEAAAIARYHAAITEMFRIGHWSGEPDVDSQLPDELMPSVYKSFWAKLQR